LAFEDIITDFEKKFSQWSQDCTRTSDFVLGSEYSVYDILILVRNYDTRAGGMFVLEVDEKPSAVVIKATLKGGRYSNAWIEEPTRLKYYLKSIDGVFGEHFKPNASIMNTPGIPILTFVRTSDTAPFIFRGIFNYRDIYRELDGLKWFDLHLAAQQPSDVVAESEYVAKTFADATKISASTLREERLARLKIAPKKPPSIRVLSTAFIRNPDVVAEVLYRAGGLRGM
jgi:5-methylcytosine-specific restriction protein A